LRPRAKPIALYASEDCRVKNRRVELVKAS
jgi:outer membrane protein OmpA-like peptidoglycan-associated protein